MITLAMLLDDGRRDLLPTLAAHWNRLQLDAPARWVVAGNDAGPATRRRFEELVRHPVTWVEADLQPVGEMLTPDALGFGEYTDPAFSHKLALLREAVRAEALLGGEWVMWLDSDVACAPEAYLQLRHDLEATSGHKAPLAVAGIYPERGSGRQIVCHWPDHPIALRRDWMQPCGWTGFGCVLTHRAALEAVPFGRYTAYRRHRARRLEAEHVNRVKTQRPIGLYGEDVLWWHDYERIWGMPCYVDTRVTCRHYHRDGSYWCYRPDGEEGLRAAYVTEDADATRRVRVRHEGAAVIDYPEYDLRLYPGESCHVSPEVAGRMRRTQPGITVETPEREVVHAG